MVQSGVSYYFPTAFVLHFFASLCIANAVGEGLIHAWGLFLTTVTAAPFKILVNQSSITDHGGTGKMLLITSYPASFPMHFAKFECFNCPT